MMGCALLALILICLPDAIARGNLVPLGILVAGGFILFLVKTDEELD